MKFMYMTIAVTTMLSMLPSECVNADYKGSAIPQELQSSHAELTLKPIDQTFAYSIYEKQYKDEMAKVGYLINLVRYSENHFWRNGSIFDGQRAAEWLDFKVNKYYQEIKGAEDFIEKVGSYSLRSQKDYYVIYPDNSRCPMKTAYYNELKRLSAYENRIAEKTNKRSARNESV
ncbi:MAG: DUF5329 domain-containing protein [Candidatus Omnitrophica bacterium]|nr:DUF5329 domain-containing protein [Candidatus Omnitrophota bacterium]